MEFFSEAHQEVTWFYVSMHETLIMQELKAWDYLICDHQHRFQWEFPIADLKIVFQWSAQQLSYHKIEISVFTMPEEIGNPHSSLNLFQYFALVGRKARLDSFRLAFDGAVGVGLDIPTWVDSRAFSFVELVFELVAPADSDLQRAHSNISINYTVLSNHRLKVHEPRKVPKRCFLCWIDKYFQGWVFFWASSCWSQRCSRCFIVAELPLELGRCELLVVIFPDVLSTVITDVGLLPLGRSLITCDSVLIKWHFSQASNLTVLSGTTKVFLHDIIDTGS